MDGGQRFELSYDATRAEFERGVLARLDATGRLRRSRMWGAVMIVLGLFLVGMNLVVVDPSGALPSWWAWLIGIVALASGILQVALWDRRWQIGRYYRANMSLLAVHVDERLDADGALSTSAGLETRLSWDRFSAVIECDDLLVLCLGDIAKGGQWTSPRRGLSDARAWPQLVSLAREKVEGPYFRSSR